MDSEWIQLSSSLLLVMFSSLSFAFVTAGFKAFPAKKKLCLIQIPS